MGVHPTPLTGCSSVSIEIDIELTWKPEEALVIEFDIFTILRVITSVCTHTFYFRGFAGFARPISSRVVCVVVYAKVPLLSLHAKYRDCKAKQAAALFYFGSNTHTTQEESADSSRRNVAGPILYCHRYKITCDWYPNCSLD